jgi:hypothetical protein
MRKILLLITMSLETTETPKNVKLLYRDGLKFHHWRLLLTGTYKCRLTEPMHGSRRPGGISWTKLKLGQFPLHPKLDLYGVMSPQKLDIPKSPDVPLKIHNFFLIPKHQGPIKLPYCTSLCILLKNLIISIEFSHARVAIRLHLDYWVVFT